MKLLWSCMVEEANIVYPSLFLDCINTVLIRVLENRRFGHGFDGSRSIARHVSFREHTHVDKIKLKQEQTSQCWVLTPTNAN